MAHRQAVGDVELSLRLAIARLVLLQKTSPVFGSLTPPWEVVDFCGPIGGRIESVPAEPRYPGSVIGELEFLPPVTRHGGPFAGDAAGELMELLVDRIGGHRLEIRPVFLDCHIGLAGLEE